MNKTFLWLSSLLIVQIVLAIGLYWGTSSHTGQQAQRMLLNVKQEMIDKIVIQGDKQTALLQKKEGQWRLPSLDDLPVNQDQLQSVLNKLVDVKYHWPIATTKSSHQRFDVDDDQFQRRITLYKGEDMVTDVLLGTSPGFRKVHARLAGENNVYALALNTFDFPNEDKQWMNKALLAAKDITLIQTPHYTLKKSDDNWLLENDVDDGDRVLDQEKVNQLSQALTSLAVLDIAQETQDVLSESWIKVDIIGDNKWSYQWLEKDGQYYVKRDDINQVFTVSQSDYERVVILDLSKLYRQPQHANMEEENTDPTVVKDSLPVEPPSDFLPGEEDITTQQ
ncbi:hypothetical protein AB835_14035 [Candidatus Endobugula sertula]|uniref:DUF4340 domain-containing protein n=1 Tax=Candidatus Endobugula sertula TaxID=62101 RepID=A0A1D2QLM3_9GAMM|nr:hypothetical protein AB835_14035 [Candidatus Endobugula sertula]